MDLYITIGLMVICLLAIVVVIYSMKTYVAKVENANRYTCDYDIGYNDGRMDALQDFKRILSKSKNNFTNYSIIRQALHELEEQYLSADEEVSK